MKLMNPLIKSIKENLQDSFESYSLQNLCHWDDVNDNNIEPCREYTLFNGPKGKVYICIDRSSGILLVKLNDQILINQPYSPEDLDYMIYQYLKNKKLI